MQLRECGGVASARSMFGEDIEAGRLVEASKPALVLRALGLHPLKHVGARGRAVPPEELVRRNALRMKHAANKAEAFLVKARRARCLSHGRSASPTERRPSDEDITLVSFNRMQIG